MKTHRILYGLFSICTLLAVSCGNNTSSKSKTPACYFNESVKNLRWIDLEKKLADTLKIANNGKEKAFAFSYSKDGKASTVTEVGTDRSIEGQVTKYKDVYFINAPKDSVYQLYAFIIKQNTSVIGLAEIFDQPKAVYRIVSSGHDDGLVASEVNGDYYLEADKKKILTLYSSVILDSDTWELVK